MIKGIVWNKTTYSQFYETSFENRRDLYHSVARIPYAKDQEKTLKRFEKKFGPIVSDLYCEIVPLLKKHCLAVCYDKLDESLCNRFGWFTMETMTKMNLDKLRKDLGK